MALRVHHVPISVSTRFAHIRCTILVKTRINCHLMLTNAVHGQHVQFTQDSRSDARMQTTLHGRAGVASTAPLLSLERMRAIAD